MQKYTRKEECCNSTKQVVFQDPVVHHRNYMQDQRLDIKAHPDHSFE